ncbi:MAG TPA: cytochrome c biogenesis protein CcsA [Verrucomicrobiae bacterium]|jgi:ABC-type transport system involved in cytochrome c biogenesis permease subunit|nr:cytochrome c biogenesis protein CcsA [Verrucomicrobiae bacterium]
MKRRLPLIFAAVFAAWFLSGAQPPKSENGFDMAAFGRLPVLRDGRLQPLDSVARNSLLTISGKSIVRLTNGPPLSATRWLLDTMTRPQIADTYPIFRVQHPDLGGLFGVNNATLTSLSFNDITNEFEHLQSQVDKLRTTESSLGDEAEKLRTPYQKDLMHLWSSLTLYQRLKNSLEAEGTTDFKEELEIYAESITPGKMALLQAEDKKDANQEDLQRISAFFNRYQELARLADPLIIPPRPDQPRNAWSNIGTNLLQSMRDGEIHPAALSYAALSTAYNHADAPAFNQAIVKYRVWLQENNLYPALKKGSQEYFFNQMEPFYKAMIIYVAALLLGCLYWVNLSEWMRRSGFALLALAFVIHTFGLLFRMYLEGRPPVTNLYSSAIFIGWGSCLLGIILERIFKGAIGLVSAGFIGFITLIIAHHLALSGDTMEMLRAVLDTNIWLATHVVVVTTGYASMFVAGLLAIIYIVRGFFTRTLTPDLARNLTRMVYGIVCFATLFSFVGTILGGIWADQSWGRFWGWDPKENGALLIVLWNAVILHARWGGMIRERGLMAMAVFGNIVTSFSWFGVNMLGIGLHSYGFMDKALFWLIAFDVSQVILIVLTLLPARYWASLRPAAPTSSPSTPIPA